MSKSRPTPPSKRQSARYQRLQKQKAYQRPSLLARLRGLHGRARVFAIAAALLVVVGVAGATGGTALAINQENHDDFCASCHTEPESKYYAQTRAPQPETLAAFHTTKNVRCIDCHSGGGPLGRVQGLTQGAQDALSYYSGNYRKPAVTTSKLGDESCTKCHDQVYFEADFNTHFHRFLPQWQSRDPNAAGCVDCHTAHPTNPAGQNYTNDTALTPVCERCHNALGRE